MVFAVEGLDDIKTLPVEALGFAKAASFILDCAEVDQIVGNMRMMLAVKFAVHAEDPLVQGFRDIKVPRIKMRIRQLGEAFRQVRAGRSGLGLQASRLLQHSDRS